MRRRLIPMALVAGVLVQAEVPASQGSAPPVNVSQGWLKHALEPTSHAFKLRSQERDSKGKRVHRFDHYFKGIRILKSEGIAHVDDQGNVLHSAYAYGQLLDPSGLDVATAFSESKALAVVKAKSHQTRMGLFRPTVELAIEPLLERFRKEGDLPVFGDLGSVSNAQAYGRELKGFRLVYLVHAWDPQEQDQMGYKVDAKTGETIERYRTSSCASGTAQGLYNPNTPISVNTTGGSFSLVNGIFSTRDNNTGYLYTKSGSSIFGDGQAYQGNPLNTNGETAAADAFYGATTAFTFYQNIFGRNGIDGYSVPLYVHDTSSPGNAFAHWYQDPWAFGGYSYWITFGDANNEIGSMVDTDIVAHEYSHLVNFRSAQVGRDGGGVEQKAINEANSDILAAFSKIWSQNGKGFSVGYSDPANRTRDWVNGDRVVRADKGGSGTYYCVRDLAWPSGTYSNQFSKDRSQSWYVGSSPWSDGHYGTGPIARGMYILSQGLSPYVSVNSSTRQWTSPHLPFGMQGIGPDDAARIWYWALTHRFTSNMNYLFLWADLELSAIDLYGRGSTQHQAVNNALAAVNIASPSRTTDLIYDVEPNDTPAQATVLPQGHVHHVNAGQIAPNGDYDWYQLTVPAGHTLSIWVQSGLESGVPNSSAPGFELRDASGATLLRDYYQNPIEYKLPIIYTAKKIHNIDEPEPPPVDGYLTKAFYHYKNTGSGDQTVYLKIRQGTADASGTTYTLDARDWIMDVANLASLASEW